MSRSVRFVGAALIPAFTLPLAGTATARSTAVPPPPTNNNLPKDLDVASPYIPQSVCDPSPKEGVTAFARLMANHYDEFNYGISRACNYGLTEHSEGRALDWMLNAYDPHERAVADGVISWLLAPDSEGRPAAMARRFGIMYIIWNRQIWGTYQMDEGWRSYNGVSPHTDHIHFSFSWDGAMKRTSWWTGVAWTSVTRTPGGPSVPLPDPDSYPTLREGASGPDVQLAQKVLGVSADGVFGPATKSALRTWQSKNDVPVTGVLDQATWDKMVQKGDIPPRGGDGGGELDTYLTTTVRLGSTGDSVKALQRTLGITADGAFGSQTENAVKQFQEDKELKADGVVSPNVWRALAGLSYTKTAKTSTNPLEPYMDTKIRKGDRGAAVKAAQKVVGVTADGIFGSGTEAAVKAYQKKMDLLTNGVVSPNVWRAMAGWKYTKTALTADEPSNPLEPYMSTKIRKGDRGAAVKAAQKVVGVTADGIFGSGTERAVKAYQKRKDLLTNGIVSPNVWRAMAGWKYTKTALAADEPSNPLEPYMDTKIRKGDRGAAVKAAQKVVGVTADGVFGSGTERAVKAYQKRKDLLTNGIVSPNVWRAMAGEKYTKTALAADEPSNPLEPYMDTKIRKGDRGAAVKAAQKVVGVTADGIFGSGTEAAVKAYQKRKDLLTNGIVSPNVWRAMAGEKYTRTALTVSRSTRTASATTSSTATSAATVVTRTEFADLRSTVLAQGARGAEVKVLQRALGGVAVDGVYGSSTVKAVRSFQEAKGLRVTGIADEKLWIDLERQTYPFLRYRTQVLKPGSTGQAVREVQQALGLEADGVYGTSTKDAVKSLQGRHHLTRTGYVGGVTWQALEREVRGQR